MRLPRSAILVRDVRFGVENLVQASVIREPVENLRIVMTFVSQFRASDNADGAFVPIAHRRLERDSFVLG